MTYKIPLRSDKVTQGREASPMRSLSGATGTKEEQFGKPLIAIANSFTDFVPGHVHLHEVGRRVKKRIEKLGCSAKEFHTPVVCDGIAMGHKGMNYSLPSRGLIANTVETMVNAHCVDAIIFITNCDKSVPGMLMAMMRHNVPAVIVSGGPMEAGEDGKDLIDVFVISGDKSASDAEVSKVEKTACKTCGSCAGAFTANSTNCSSEALGVALPGNGTVLATHADRLRLFDDGADLIVPLALKYYRDGDESVLPRSIATRSAFLNAMKLEIAMGGSTNVVLHLLAVAHEAGVNFTQNDIDTLSRTTPNLCRIAPSSHYHMEDFGRAGGVMGVMAELARGDLIDKSVGHVALHTKQHAGVLNNLGDLIAAYDIVGNGSRLHSGTIYSGSPSGIRTTQMGQWKGRYDELDTDRENGCIRDIEHAYSPDGGLAVLYGNLAPDGCIVKTAGVDSSNACHGGEGGCL